MKFIVSRSSDISNRNDYEVELKTLEELLTFMKNENKPIIIDTSDNAYTLEIYDYWRE